AFEPSPSRGANQDGFNPQAIQIRKRSIDPYSVSFRKLWQQNPTESPMSPRPVPLYNCDQQGCFDSVARIGSLVLTVTQEAFWKLGKRLLSSLNDLMGIPVIQNSYSPLMELAKV
ncbi:hypothetical protein HID58_026865, partial [Brassica napus]